MCGELLFLEYLFYEYEFCFPNQGFLAELMKGCSLDCCIASGHYAANYILRQVGVQLPDAPDYKCTEPAKKLHVSPAKRDASGKQ